MVYFLSFSVQEIMLYSSCQYAIDQIHRTMTVGELIDCLSEFPEDAQIYLSHDRGYTYGGITEQRIYTPEEDEEED